MINRRVPMFQTALMFAAVIVLAVVSRPATAQSDIERQIREMEEQIERHLREAEELRAGGNQRAAEEHLERAEAMRAELREWFERHERERREREERPRREAQEREAPVHLHGVLEHLGEAMAMLHEHGNTELAMQLERVAHQIHQRIDARGEHARHEHARHEHVHEENPESGRLRHRLEVYHMALHALTETDHAAAEMLERAIRATEAPLEGRRDDEAYHLRESAPPPEQVRELLVLAIETFHRFGAGDRAQQLKRAAEELFHLEAHREQPHREHPEARGHAMPERLQQKIEALHLAHHGLSEAGRHELAELIEHAIHAQNLRLEGARGEEAMRVIESSPPPEAIQEAVHVAIDVWHELGHEDRARTLAELAGQPRRRDGDAGPRELAGLADHVDELHRQLAEMRQAMEELRDQIHALHQRRDR